MVNPRSRVITQGWAPPRFVICDGADLARSMTHPLERPGSGAFDYADFADYCAVQEFSGGLVAVAFVGGNRFGYAFEFD
jgi:hypothetical protein